MKKLLILLSILYSFQANAEIIECPKLKGSMLNFLNEKFENIDFESDTTIFQYDSKEGIILSGEEKDSCIVIENNDDFVSCISVSKGMVNVNLWTYNKKDKKIYYSKQGYTISQYYAKCVEK